MLPHQKGRLRSTKDKRVTLQPFFTYRTGNRKHTRGIRLLNITIRCEIKCLFSAECHETINTVNKTTVSSEHEDEGVDDGDEEEDGDDNNENEKDL